jgi:heme/copper-type cytochrome/quinol oxidase subunit 2
MLAPGLVVWHQFVTIPADATEIEVMGQQWQWSFRLPGKDGRLGTTDVRNTSSERPHGLASVNRAPCPRAQIIRATCALSYAAPPRGRKSMSSFERVALR